MSARSRIASSSRFVLIITVLVTVCLASAQPCVTAPWPGERRELHGIEWGDGLWMALESEGVITSQGGEFWQAHPAPWNLRTSLKGYDLHHFDGHFVLADESFGVWISEQGLDWRRLDDRNSAPPKCSSAPPWEVAFADDGTSLLGTGQWDCTFFEQHSIKTDLESFEAFERGFADVTWDGERFVVLACGTFVSKDGIEWREMAKVPGGVWTTLRWARPGQYAAVDRERLWLSEDLEEWTEVDLAAWLVFHDGQSYRVRENGRLLKLDPEPDDPDCLEPVPDALVLERLGS